MGKHRRKICSLPFILPGFTMNIKYLTLQLVPNTWTISIFCIQYDGSNTSKNRAGVSHLVAVAQTFTSEL